MELYLRNDTHLKNRWKHVDNNSDFTQRVDWNQAPQRLLFLISFPGQWFLQVTRKSDGNLVNLLMSGTNEMRGHLGESKPTLARDGLKTCHVPTDPTIRVFCPGTTERPDPKGPARMRVSCAVCVRDVFSVCHVFEHVVFCFPLE